MIRRPTTSVRLPSCAPRRGLAPLEFVLWLPVLLMLMALMVIYANGVAWKMRATYGARHAMWRSRAPIYNGAPYEHAPGRHNWWATRLTASPRTGDQPTENNQPADTKPGHLPVDSEVRWQNGGGLHNIGVPQLEHPVARGPSLGRMQVNSNVLDPQNGQRTGVGELTQSYPMLASYIERTDQSGDDGWYHFEIEHPILDNQWRHWEMFRPLPYHSSGNRHHRVQQLYQVPEAPGGLKNAFEQAVMQIITAPWWRDLAPLDRDAEWENWFNGTYNRHPGLPMFVELDPQVVRETRIINPGGLVDRIQGKQSNPSVASVAMRVADLYIGLYRSKASYYRSLMPPNDALAQMYDDKAEEYEDFKREAQQKRPS